MVKVWIYSSPTLQRTNVAKLLKSERPIFVLPEMKVLPHQCRKLQFAANGTIVVLYEYCLTRGLSGTLAVLHVCSLADVLQQGNTILLLLFTLKMLQNKLSVICDLNCDYLTCIV